MGVGQSVEQLMMLRGTDVDPVIGALATPGLVERDGTIAVHAGEETVANAELSSPTDEGDVVAEETSTIAALRVRVSRAFKGL